MNILTVVVLSIAQQTSLNFYQNVTTYIKLSHLDSLNKHIHLQHKTLTKYLMRQK